MYVGHKRKGDKMDKRERTDLEIEGMRKRISDECKFGISRTLPCDHCKIARACKRCYDTPSHNGCDDWETDDVLVAYELLREDK